MQPAVDLTLSDTPVWDAQTRLVRLLGRHKLFVTRLCPHNLAEVMQQVIDLIVERQCERGLVLHRCERRTYLPSDN